MCRHESLAFLFLTVGLAQAAPPQKLSDTPREWQIDPLPKGAMVRLGYRTCFGGPSSFSEDGKTLCTPADGQLFSWDAATGREIQPRRFAPADKGMSTSSYAVSGNRLFALNYSEYAIRPQDRKGVVTVTDLAGGARLSQIPVTGPLKLGSLNPSHLSSLAVTPNGKYLAFISEAESSVEVFAAQTGQRLHSQKLESTYGVGIYPSADAKVLYVQVPGKPLKRFDLVSGTALPDLDGTNGLTNFIDASPDGKWAVTRESFVQKDADGNVVSIEDHPYLMVCDAFANKTIGKLNIGSTPTAYKFVGSDAVIVLTRKVRPPGPRSSTRSAGGMSSH